MTLPLHELLERRFGVSEDEFAAALEEFADRAGPIAIADLRPAEYFGEAQRSTLQELGASLKPLRSSGLGPIAGIALAHAELVTKSVSVADAAERLGVDPSRIRQRIHARSLYAFKHRGSWLIPSFQFIDGNLIAGIGEVGVRLPTALHPVAVARWFASPNADLVLAGHAVSPITWLASGGLVEPAAVSAGDADQL